jgi:hypothetical protein
MTLIERGIPKGHVEGLKGSVFIRNIAAALKIVLSERCAQQL